MAVPDPFSVVALFFQASEVLFQGPKVLTISRKGVETDLGFPAGKIELGETPEEALRREVLEEVGVVVEQFRHCFDHTDGVSQHVARCFWVESWVGEPVAVEAGTVVAWHYPARLLEPSCTFHVYNRALFEALGLL